MAGTASTYLVTGGAGFIGSHVTERLLGDGHRVRVLDNLSTGKASNLAFAAGLGEGRFELIEADLVDGAAVQRAVEGVEAVFHLAALPSVPRSIDDPLASHRVNTTGTLTLLLAARDASVERFIYASSSSVYGATKELPKVETMRPRPLSPYATGKITGEYYCQVFHHLDGLGCIALRYFNVFGPRQDPSSEYAAVIPRFLEALTRGEDPIIYGDGLQSRDFTYVSDVVEANLLALRAGPRALGRTYNVAGGHRVTLLEVLAMLGRILGRDIKPRFQPARPGDVRHSQADSRQAAERLSWTAKVGVEEGLQRLVESMRAGEAHAL